MSDRCDWTEVTADAPCMACGKPDWCSRAGDRWATCRRPERADPPADWRRVKGTADGAQVWTCEPRTAATAANIAPVADGELASPDVLDRVHGAILTALPCSGAVDAEAERRGVSRHDLHRLGLRSLDRSRTAGVRAAMDAGLEEHFPDVPALSLRRKDGGMPYWSLPGRGGVIVPVYDGIGRIVRLQRRDPKATGKTGRYTWLSGGKRPGGTRQPKSSAVANVTPIPHGPVNELWLTEGILKSHVAALLTGKRFVGLPSVAGAAGLIGPVIEALGLPRAVVAFDMDWQANADVKRHLVTLLERLVRMTVGGGPLDVAVATWGFAETGDPKGIDDLHAMGREPHLWPAADWLVEFASELVGAETAEALGGLPRLACGHLEAHVVDEALPHLATLPDLYAMGPALTRLVPGADDFPVAGPVKAPTLRESVTRVVECGHYVQGDDGESWKSIRVPGWLVSEIAARGHYPDFRPLQGVTGCPSLRPDGSVLAQPGYDPETSLYLHWTGEPLRVPDEPTQADAVAAAGRLLALVADVPLVSDTDRAGWLCGLLTPVARPAIGGPCPMFVVDANVRSAGKTLLVEVIERLCTGRRQPPVGFPSTDDECDKRLLAVLLEGRPMLCFDNLNGPLGCASLDRMLTADRYSSRVLGVSEMACPPVRTVFYATGNAVQFRADTVRRVCPIRLETADERPETRSGFAIPDLPGHVDANRRELLADALTLLRAYAAAGRPPVASQPWGSFGDWSRVVRDAVAWCGLPDPATGRTEMEQAADLDRAALGELLAAVFDATDGTEWKVRDLLALADRGHAEDRLRDAIVEYAFRGDRAGDRGELPSTGKLGYRLRSATRTIDGLRLRSVGKSGGATRWQVQSVAAGLGRCDGNMGCDVSAAESPAATGTGATAHAVHANADRSLSFGIGGMQ